MRNGKGKMIYNNVDEYYGEWKDDMKNGEGEIFYINKQDKFKDEFENNTEKNGERIIITEEYICIGKIIDYKKNENGKIYKKMAINIMVNLKMIKRIEKVSFIIKIKKYMLEY